MLMRSLLKLKYIKHHLLVVCLIGYFVGGNTKLKADALSTTLNSLRICYDVKFYNLELKVDFDDRSIKGKNDIYFEVVEPCNKIQIDLDKGLVIDRISYSDRTLSYGRDKSAIYIDFEDDLKVGSKHKITVHYSGKPKEAVDPPWNGGFVWSEDETGTPLLGVTCEGIGASTWWPCKDHPSDEPDSVRIKATVPEAFFCISNGQLRAITKNNGLATFEWFVSYPINLYNVTLNVGDYENFKDYYYSPYAQDTLELDYYVLSYNLDTAKKHFQQVPNILGCLEKRLGKYPFYRDGYALVETSYLGMEHQGAIAYGNNYQNGYMGELTAGLPFDRIIMHETAHEWWGNSITAADLSELWIQESFCTYSEALFVECEYGYDKMIKYLLEQKKLIQNKAPMLGVRGSNKQPKGTDVYYKGAWMLHTLRNVINNDSLWNDVVLSLSKEKYLSIVSTEEIVSFISKEAGQDFTAFFNEYLKYTTIPTLQYKVEKKKKYVELYYRWKVNELDFSIPIKAIMGQELPLQLFPTTEWKSLKLEGVQFINLDIPKELYYINCELVTD